MNKLFTFLCFLLLSSIAFAQPPEFNSAPAQSGDALEFTIEFPGYPTGLDYLIVVDSDDPTTVIGSGFADPFNGTNVGTGYSNPPSGSPGEVSIIYYDASVPSYHVILDDNGDPLRIPFVPFGDGSSGELDGYQNVAIGVAYPGEGSPTIPGSADFATQAAALPVELTTFTAQSIPGKYAALTWSTATEDGNEFFELERSADARNFTTVSRLQGAGVSRTNINYSFNDRDYTEGVNYYRLRQIDFDGTEWYSEIISVMMEGGSSTGALAYPNPATATFRLTLDAEWATDAPRLQLFNAAGRMVLDQAQQSGSSQEINVRDLPTGVYQLRVTDGKRDVTQRLLIN